MKLSTFLALAGAALVAAQDLSKLPTCSKECAASKITGTDCGINPVCFCSDKAFITDIAACVAEKCKSEDDLKVTIDFAVEICNAVGVKIDTTLPTTTPATTTEPSVPSTSPTASTVPTGSTGGKNDTINTPKPGSDKDDEDDKDGDDKDGDNADSSAKGVRSSLIGVVGALAAAVLLL